MMKLTKETLKQIIKEEVQAVLNEEEKKRHHVVLEPDGSVSSIQAKRATRFVIGQLEANATTPGSKVITADRKKIESAILKKVAGKVKLDNFVNPDVYLRNYLVYISK